LRKQSYYDGGAIRENDMRKDLKAEVRERFGAAADAYARSEVHAKGESLTLLVELLEPRQEWQALDVATGAGHTAMAIAPLVGRMVATDITSEMVLKTAATARSRGIVNMDVSLADVESLPFKDASFDLVTCRIALHHFSDAPRAVGEVARILKPGAIFGLDDNIVVEGGAAEEYYNTFEKVRDPSHNRAYTAEELRSMLEGQGLNIVATGYVTKEVEFRDWADRQHVAARDKERLLRMLRDLPAPLDSMLNPRFSGDTAYFTLQEAVIVAKKN
jgi:ubiquinone/menaquinone biosynthesis C-methylase UbiE